jgi:hypothetical protein
MPVLRELQFKQYDGRFADFQGGSFRPRRDKKLPFILRWELPLAVC